jgi:simple sugar transport system permease protein
MIGAPAPTSWIRAPFPPRLRLPGGGGIAVRIAVAILLSLVSSALLVLLSGHNPLTAFAAMAVGAVGSPHQLGVALNRSTPYLLAGSGVAVCFRAGVINIGAEGQIALGGVGAAAVGLHWPDWAAALSVPAALAGAALLGALWAALAAAIHLSRRVHEVLVTLLLNFVALLPVQQALAGPLGQFGAGFLQSPAMPVAASLWRLPGFDAHVGFFIALALAAGLSLMLWRTPFGFSLRMAGHSHRAAAYAGFSMPRIAWGVMLIAGALAGLAGGVEVLGVHHRLIEGFSLCFGFKAVTVALLGAIEPMAVAPAALFVGLLEAASLSMRRQIGVPSALVVVIEGLTMLFVLAATVRRT